ncbi:MAG: hypothetical protein C0171_02680 [Caldisphaera sp.]|nr:MAG: hypothetical protein C0201_01860 [Caldisphaera sp.]PMP91425.1 MAG: hypothetical protein C0171_02680 [Caldisphaera sp.]
MTNQKLSKMDFIPELGAFLSRKYSENVPYIIIAIKIIVIFIVLFLKNFLNLTKNAYIGIVFGHSFFFRI